MTQAIEIKCSYSKLLRLSALKELQGNLKSLSKVNYDKMKKQILELGFSSPVHIWENDGEYFILDGTQRTRVLKQMNKEGFDIKEVPVVFVDASDFKEARRKVLALASQYGSVTEDGLYEFMTEAQLSMPEINDNFTFPEIDMKEFIANFGPEESPTPKLCPHCGKEV